MRRKGIILAGGSGTRLFPATISVSKQLMPIYDKPMIYYPLSTLMEAGIREILIITRPEDQNDFKNLLKDGTFLGLNIQYAIQNQPKGLAEAFLIAEDFLDGSPSCLILGDNLFHGGDLIQRLVEANESQDATFFGYKVQNPSSYGVLKFNENGDLVDIVEKPVEYVSDYAVPGIYFLDERAPLFAKNVMPSARGELEIVDVLKQYIKTKEFNIVKLCKTVAWLDTGTSTSMMDASEYVRIIEERQSTKIGCIEEIAYNKMWMAMEDLDERIALHGKSEYAEYLKKIKNGA